MILTPYQVHDKTSIRYTIGDAEMSTHQITCTIAGKSFSVKESNGKFFYWSPKALRWLPIRKEKVVA
jgi:hypothetical protein